MKTHLPVNETDKIYKRMPLDTKEEGYQSPPTILQQLTYTAAILHQPFARKTWALYI